MNAPLTLTCVLAALLLLCAGLRAEPGDTSEPYELPPGTVTAEPGGMALWQAAVLGIVEGATEYLPVSSTGHLVVTQRLMGLDGGQVTASDEAAVIKRAEEMKAAADAYAICIQAGAILAVLGLYARRVRQGVMGVLGKDPVGKRLTINLIVAFVPAAIIGLLLDDWIEQQLFGVWPIVAAWAVGGIAILAVALTRRDRIAADGIRQGIELNDLAWNAALVIGLAQCLAMWPGTSRSLVTIVAGVLIGMRLAAAVEFSFLLGVVTLGAATAYKALKSGDIMIDEYGPLAIAVGFIAAFVSAAIAVKWMVAYLNRHGLAIFGWYRIAIAAVVAVMVLLGWM